MKCAPFCTSPLQLRLWQFRLLVWVVSVPCRRPTWWISLRSQSPIVEVRIQFSFRFWIMYRRCTFCFGRPNLALFAGEAPRILWFWMFASSPFSSVASWWTFLCCYRYDRWWTRNRRQSSGNRQCTTYHIGWTGRGGLLPSRVRVSEPGVGYSYRAHLTFVPDSSWWGYGYDPQGCLPILVMVPEGCVACTATLESRILMLTAKPRGTRVSSSSTSRFTWC